jgi:hypothetical protein
MRDAYKTFVGEAEGKWPLETLRHGWQDDIEGIVPEGRINIFA